MCLKATGATNTLKRSSTDILKIFVTILCLLSLVTYGIIGAQTQRTSTIGADTQTPCADFELAEASEMINGSKPSPAAADLIMN
eukprot:5750898-Karenia_brevis.AAC.1